MTRTDSTSQPGEYPTRCGSENHQLSKDEIFELLKNRRRRQVLHYLIDAEETVTLGELAEVIAAWENETDIVSLNSDQRKRVYVALYQTHLPKMDDTNVIEYNKDRGLITLAGNAELLMMYLDTSTEQTVRWNQWYAVVGFLGIAFIGGVLVGVPALNRMRAVIIVASVFAVVLAIVLAHTNTAKMYHRIVDGKQSRIK